MFGMKRGEYFSRKNLFNDLKTSKVIAGRWGYSTFVLVLGDSGKI
jgi:hypothetical protein